MRYRAVLALIVIMASVSGAQAPADTTKKPPAVIIKLTNFGDTLVKKDTTAGLSSRNSASSRPRGPTQNAARAGVGRQKTYRAIPKDAMIEKYPIVGESISQAELEGFGLHLDTLSTPWVGLNWFRNVGRFAYDSLPAGTVIYVDAAGEPRYKADCKNRLVELNAMVDAMRSTGTTTVDSLPDWITKILEKGITVNLAVPDQLYTVLLERRESEIRRSWWEDNDHWVVPAVIGTAVALIVFKPFSNKNVVKIGH